MPKLNKLSLKSKKGKEFKLKMRLEKEKKDMTESGQMTALSTMLMVPESSGTAGSLVVSMITLR